MKNLLSDFIGFDHNTMVRVYTEDYHWGEEDYNADKDHAIELLDDVERRMESLRRYLIKEKAGKDSYQPASECQDGEPTLSSP